MEDPSCVGDDWTPRNAVHFVSVPMSGGREEEIVGVTLRGARANQAIDRGTGTGTVGDRGAWATRTQQSIAIVLLGCMRLMTL